MERISFWNTCKQYNGFIAVKIISPPCDECSYFGRVCCQSVQKRSTKCEACIRKQRPCTAENQPLPAVEKYLWSKKDGKGAYGLESPDDEAPYDEPISEPSSSTGCRYGGVQQTTTNLSTAAIQSKKHGRAAKRVRFSDTSELQSETETGGMKDTDHRSLTKRPPSNVSQNTSSRVDEPTPDSFDLEDFDPASVFRTRIPWDITIRASDSEYKLRRSAIELFKLIDDRLGQFVNSLTSHFSGDDAREVARRAEEFEENILKSFERFFQRLNEVM
ncbi:hypothetical protein O181_066336 [Austropuccinia psidii MF-1]|uniref:Uncharacterized protein n=1 Tax=Austropuccinia psidii MF-1 TaxID=1389203 RepID=A0A9Q3EQS0_9BASI|nr:hypothetical protein [Austropuccinia psidii MF-1]